MRRKLAKEDRYDLIFHALADRTRRAQLARLLKGPARIKELAEPFAMSLPAASKHVRVLEAAGLVSRTIDGRVHRCALQAEPLQEIESWLERYRSFWSGKLDALAEFAEGEQPPTERS